MAKDAVKEKEAPKKTTLGSGEKVKVVKDSPAHDKTETVPGIREGKVGKY